MIFTISVKNIVTFMLEVNGFDVLDIGVDVPPEVLCGKIKEFQPQVVRALWVADTGF